MSEETAIQESGGEVVVYEAPDGHVRVEVLIGDDTVWLTQRQMADLFDTTPRNVGIHIQNAYGEGELAEGATAAAIRSLRDDLVARGEAPGLLGQERGDALESILAGIEQTFGGDPL